MEYFIAIFQHFYTYEDLFLNIYIIILPKYSLGVQALKFPMAWGPYGTV